jgi:N-acetylglucosamine kinase-like BadF-type ATPase
MADAFPEGPGVLVVAGTGSIAWARALDGTTVRVGGWGQLLGDEGSGYDIGLSGLRAVARAADGRGEPTALTDAIPDHLGLAAPDALIAWAAAASKAQIAALAPIVLRCADGGDAAALALRSAAVDALVELVATAARRVDANAPQVALAGGLIAGDGPLRAHVSEALRRRLPQARVSDRPVDAALGAARIARTLTAST